MIIGCPYKGIHIFRKTIDIVRHMLNNYELFFKFYGLTGSPWDASIITEDESIAVDISE